jgi:hypothetical protein
MIEDICKSCKRKGITRLCHFTPSRNLVHIATDPRGLLSSRHLGVDERAVFNPTDIERLDGYTDHICCSIQYPNAWYFKKAREKDRIFSDWVVLLIKPYHLWMHGTKFCPRNAAACYGGQVGVGAEAFEAIFAPRVSGAYDKTFTRSSTHPTWLPTDDQAEVLIPDQVAREDVIGIAVMDESQAKREIARLEQLKERVPRVVIASDFFNPRWLSSQLRRGVVPSEREYHPGDSDV